MSPTLSSLVLVRHGQASYGAVDYDRLSPLGEHQSRKVGRRLAGERPRASAVIAGPRRRHLQTATLLVEAARAAGGDYPDPIVDEDLDELPVKELVLAHLAGAVPAPGAALMELVVAAVRAWASGSLAPPDVITPAGFVARVEGAYRRLFPENESAVLVTSGGPIAVALFRGHALGDIGEAIMRGLQLANASITLLSRDLALLGCDPVAHLAPDEITQI